MSRIRTTAGSREAADAGSEPSLRLSIAVAGPGIEVAQLERFLASLGPLDEDGEADEVVIAIAPSPGQLDEFERWLAAPRLEPGVSVALHPADTTPMRLWGFAMAKTRGRHVAVLDARDAPAEGWQRAWREAAKTHPNAIIWGPVVPGNLKDHCSWAAYLAEYGHFWRPQTAEPKNTSPSSNPAARAVPGNIPAVPGNVSSELPSAGTAGTTHSVPGNIASGAVSEVPGNNLVFPRAALPSADALLAGGFWKTFHLDSLRAAATDTPLRRQTAPPASFLLAPGMLVRVDRRYRVREYLRRRYLHGRCYGGRRLQQPGAPPRILCLAFSPLLPALRIGRVLSRLAAPRDLTTARLSPSDWPRAALGPLVLGEVAWSWGEFAGYARGPGNACEELG